MHEHILLLGQSDRKGASKTNTGAKDPPEPIVSCRTPSTTTKKLTPAIPDSTRQPKELSPKSAAPSYDLRTKAAKLSHQILNPTGKSTPGDLVLKKQVQLRRYFVENSRLREYLHKVCPKGGYGENNYQHFFLANVLQDLSKAIGDKKLYDANNPVIILCDADLSRAVDRLGFHLQQMRDLVTNQCCAGNRYEDVNKQYSDFLLMDRLKVDNQRRRQETALALLSLRGEGEHMDPSVSIHRSGGESPVTSRSMIEYDQSPNPYPTRNRAHRISKSEQKQAVELRAKLFPDALKKKKVVQQKKNQQKEVQPKKGQQQSTNIEQDTIQETNVTFYRIRPRLWKCFKEVPSLDPEVTIYTLDQAAKILSKYILLPENKKRFFDDRNIKILHCEGTDLGRAFRVNAFHRSQVLSLLQSQIVPLIEVKEDAEIDSKEVEQITI